MTNVIAGIDNLKLADLKKFSGSMGLVCHAASIDANYVHSIKVFQKLFGKSFKKIFSPQHGLVGNVQDNMVESPHFMHPYFQLPVFSLYSETRAPKEEWLADLDMIFFDLQDVGCRIYTYIYTLSLLMQVCEKLGKKVVVLDRPNPVGGEKLEGNILEPAFSSFVGIHPIITRHAWTAGEFAQYAQKNFYPKLELEVIRMSGWKRSMDFSATGLPWVIPSPNLPTPETAFSFLATVYFEGTNISEGRGTTRSLELIGHPKLEAFSLVDRLNQSLKQTDLAGFVLRPHVFLPTFQKHAGQDCGGVQIHVTDQKVFEPWKLGQWLMKEFYHYLGKDFAWKQPPYEYIYDKLPIDVINGSDKVRIWIEKNGSYEDLRKMDLTSVAQFRSIHENFLIYR